MHTNMLKLSNASIQPIFFNEIKVFTVEAMAIGDFIIRYITRTEQFYFILAGRFQDPQKKYKLT